MLSDHDQIVEMVGNDYGFPSFWPWSEFITITIYYKTMVNHAFDWGHHDQQTLDHGEQS